MELTLYKPKCEELWFKQLMMADEETMSYNHAWGGTIPFPEERWPEWHHRWVDAPGGRRYYRYLIDGAGAFIGEISYHYDEETGFSLADVVIYAKYRGHGYGNLALQMLCAAAKENGLSSLYDDVGIDNPAIGLFLKQGFSEVYRTESAVMLKKEL